MWKKICRVLPYLGLCLGLFIVAWFPVTNYIDSKRMERILNSVEQEVIQLDTSEKDRLLDNARAYNDQLAGKPAGIFDSDILPYEEQLMIDPGRTTPFGSVIIPKINVYMPLYHGSDELTLAAGAGHLEGTSLPIGGDSTHACVSAHSGMRNLAAFDNLDRLKVGDVFGFRILGDLYCYEIDSMETVLPDEMDKLQIQDGQDRATLITCTPYGINTHRLLVSGHRCPVPENFEQEEPDLNIMVQDRRNWPLLAGIGILVLMCIVWAIRHCIHKGG